MAMVIPRESQKIATWSFGIYRPPSVPSKIFNGQPHGKIAAVPRENKRFQAITVKIVTPRQNGILPSSLDHSCRE
jgi:hypothetical protein